MKFRIFSTIFLIGLVAVATPPVKILEGTIWYSPDHSQSVTLSAITGSFGNQTANTVYAGPTSGGSATPGFRSLVLADIPGSIPASKLVGTDITSLANLVTVGTIGTGVWSGTAILPAKGGTGLSTITAHGVMIGEGTSNVAPTAAGSAGQALLSGGSSADPAWSTPTYPSASGSAGKILRSDGTNNVYSSTTWPNALTGGGLLYASSATNVASTGVLGVNTILLGGGSGQQPNTLATDASTTKSLISGGTDTAPSWGVPGATGGGTGQTTWTSGDLPYASGTNAIGKLGIGSANQVLKVVSGAPAWSAPPVSGVNYTSSNPDAEIDTSGWANYADAAGTAPVDCTGGSPTTNIARTTSSPLRGVGSFTWAKSANNRQGEGTSYAFTIDSADEAKVLNVTMDYTVASGTYSDGDMSVWLYDVTNSTLIQPSGTSILKIATGLSTRQISQFQTASNSTSYRLCLHTASTSASAYTLEWDNVSIAPQTVSYGAPITDWFQYTPTFTGFGTATSVNIWSRRVGDSLEVAGTFTTGTVTGVTAKMTVGFNGANANVTMDSVKLSTGPSVGFASLSGAGVPMATVLDLPGTNTLEFGYQTSTTGGLNAIAASSLVGNTTSVSVHAVVPIAGWSSSVQMSSDNDTRVTVAQGFKNSGSQTSSSAYQDVVFTVTEDSHSAFDGTTYTVPVPGDYVVEGIVGFTANATGARAVKVLQGGSATGYQLGNVTLGSASAQASLPFATKFKCKAGDTLKVQAYQSSGGSLTYETGDGSYVNIHKISGPASVAASETVAFYAKQQTPTGTVGGINNIVKFGTVTKDSHTGYSTSTGLYTLPITGWYQANAILEISCTWAVNNIARVGILHGAEEVAYGTQTIGSTSDIAFAAVASGLFYGKGGETVGVYSFGNGSSCSLSNVMGGSSMSIIRVGYF